MIEVASALALSWLFSTRDPERPEHLTLRIIAVSLFTLAAIVTVDPVTSLTGEGEAQHSTPGIVIAALSLAVMPVLSWAQRRAGREPGSKTAVADSKRTLLCTYLSAMLLAGRVLNSTLSWWWAGAALMIAAIAVREGMSAWRGDVRCIAPTRRHIPRLRDGRRLHVIAGTGRKGASGTGPSRYGLEGVEDTDRSGPAERGHDVQGQQKFPDRGVQHHRRLTPDRQCRGAPVCQPGFAQQRGMGLARPRRIRAWPGRADPGERGGNDDEDRDACTCIT